MVNLHENEDFDRIVYTINDDGEIEDHVLRDLCNDHAEETTTPRGVGPVIHTRGRELWTWGHQGKYPKRIETFDTEERAEHALLLCHLHDLCTRDNAPTFYNSISEALEAMADLAD